MEEAGVHGCISDTWHALTAPPKTPAAIVAKLNAAANKALTDPGLLERFEQTQHRPGRRHAGGGRALSSSRKPSAGAT